MTNAELFIDATKRVRADSDGLGVDDGESFELVAIAGPHVLRSARMYGNASRQKQTLQDAAEAFKNVTVRIDK